MDQVIIEWHDQFAILSDETDADMYQSLKRLFPIEHKSREDVEEKIIETLSNLPNNHYGKFEERVHIEHKIVF